MVNYKRKERGFALVFVIAVVAALSIMTGSMFFYYDTDLKSVSRNSVMQQVNLAAETGLQEGQRWITDQLNSNSFSLVDIQNELHIDDSANKCLNRHGYTDSTKDVYYAQRITGALGDDEAKFEDMSYEVFVMRHADIVRSIYFSAEGSKNGAEKDTTYSDRSFALVEQFNDFPTDQFTIEMWIKNMQTDTSVYNMHAFEWGREWDLVFKVKNDEWSPRLGEVVLDDQEDVGTPVKGEWVHIAWVWDGGTPNTNDTGNVKIYQNGTLSGTFNANIGARAKSGYTNPKEKLPQGDFWPLAIGEGLHGFSPNNYKTGDVKIQSVPWLGNIAEMRIWNISRSGTDIANNNRRRLSGSEPGLVSYYKFNEGSGNTAKDFNTSRAADKRNDATIYGIGNKGTLWKTELVKYPVTSTTEDAPSVNVPPGEDIVYYKIISCGNGPQGQIVPLELVVSAPVQKGDVGDGLISLTEEDLNSLTGQEGTPLKTPLSTYVGQEGVDGDIKIQTRDNSNTNFFVFKRAMEQCENSDSFTDFMASASYDEGDCANFDGKLYYLENDSGKIANIDFNEDDWSEVLGSGCDGVQFTSDSGNESYGHYYKYFSTAPNVTTSPGDLGYNGDSIDWWEAKRRAEQSTCGGMRGYLVSIESAEENEFIRQSVMCDNSEGSCSGITPFHVAAGESRANYYGSRLDSSGDQHYIWLSNSDWRNPTASATNMQSESGPNMGTSVSYVNWQSGEPNNAAEPYADMEINRASRTNGGWNDLRRIPNCNSGGGLDCITGYIVEYGGFDYFRLNHDDADDDKDVDNDTKFCVARATIEKDKYVGPVDLNSDGDFKDDNETEDFLKLDTEAEDYPSSITADTSSSESDSDTDDDYPGWNYYTGVLTLVHSEKPAEWNPASTYANGSFVWYNNRVWRNIKGSGIIGGTGLRSGETPTIYNPTVWELISGNEDYAPCADIDVWSQAFESIKYFNAKEVDAEDGENPFANEGTDGTDGSDSNVDEGGTPSLGERTILFSLGPLHVHEHKDGYNHFYEFYKFPTRASGTQNLYNDNNRRFNEGFQLSNRLHYFAKTGYLGTITSESESDILTDKAKGNGWLGGIVGTNNQNSWNRLDTCGGPRFRSTRNLAAADWRNLRTVADWPIYTDGTAYSVNDYILDVEEVLGTGSGHSTSNKTIKSVTAGSDSNDPALVETNNNHNLQDDDVIRIFTTADNSLGHDVLTNGYYRVRYINAKRFELVHFISRNPVQASGASFSDGDASLRELQGLRTSYYRVNSGFTASSNISSHNGQVNDTIRNNINNSTQTIPLDSVSGFPTSGAIIVGSEIITYTGISSNNLTGATRGAQGTRRTSHSDGAFVSLATLQKIWQGPDMTWASGSGNTRTSWDYSGTSTNAQCPRWRWVTGPEQFLWNNRGLTFSPTRSRDNSPNANNGTWTRSSSTGGPSGQQIGEEFVDGMPFRNFNGVGSAGEPNNVNNSEPALHMLGDHFNASSRYKWNDLHNWSRPHGDDYGIRGLILEYGGMENDGDPIVRIATKRVINLYDRRVTKAIVKIKSGSQTGDKLVAGSDELTKLGITATNNETSNVTLTGDATCENYLDLVRSMYFEHDASTAGTREIEVLLGDVQKPTNATHYYQLKENQLSYDQANFQSSYQNLCGIQGYLANVTTTADLDAIEELGVSNDKMAWVNGTDECQGGLYRSGFWRYTSGPWKDKEFWRVRINTNTSVETLENEASCNQTNLRPSQTSVRVGPFASANWLSTHPAADNNDYLVFKQTTTDSTTGIMTRDGTASSDVEGYVVRFGGSVGDFSGADIEEDDNDIPVILGPIRAEVSFYDDGSDNSIFVDTEDTVNVNTSGDNALSTGWAKATSYSPSGNTPMRITSPTGEVATIQQWRDELAKVYYENTDTDDFTPGNRKIKIKLVYGDANLNQEIGIVKAIGSRNNITVTPISWNNR